MIEYIPITYSNQDNSINQSRKGISRAIIEAQSSQVSFALNPSMAYRECFIESIAVPHIWDDIPSFNCRFEDHLGILHNIFISGGNWPIQDFLQSLINQLNSLDPGYIFSLFPNFTWSIANPNPGSFNLLFENNIVQQRTGLIGPHQGTSVNAIISQKYNMQSNLLLLEANLTVRGQGTSYDNLTEALLPQERNVGGKSTYVFNLPLGTNDIKERLVSQGRVEGWYFGELGVRMPIATTTTSIKFSLHDELNLPINIEPQRWYITLNFIN